LAEKVSLTVIAMMVVPPKDDENSKPPLIRRGRVESVDLYEIKDSELELFEKGSPADLQLNFAIFLLSLAFAAIIALSTASFVAHPSVQTAYIVVAVVGILLGFYLLIAWGRNRTSMKRVCLIIRRRMKETTVTADSEAIAPTTGIPSGDALEPKD
jgi:hypothetical protein